MNALWPACLTPVPLPYSFPPNPLPQYLSIPAMQASEALLRLVYTSDIVRVGDVIRSIELYDLVKTAF